MSFRHTEMLARLMPPVSGADQVRVGPLQRHRSRVTAQNPNHSGGQLLNPRNYRTHSWTDYGVINRAKIANVMEIKDKEKTSSKKPDV